MRVLQLIDRLRDQGGAERLQRTMAECARGSDVELLVATLYENDAVLQRAVEGCGVRVFPLLARRSYDPFRFLRLVRLLRSAEVEVIHTHLLRSTVLGSWAGLLTATPVVVTIHNTRPNKADHPLLLRAEKWALERLVSALVAVGPVTAEANRSRIGSRAFEVIPNAVELPPEPDTSVRNRIRAKLGVGEEIPLLVAVGRLHEQKGYVDMLEAFAELRVAHSTAELVIAGEGRDREKVTAKIAERGLERVVHLLGHRDDVAEILAASDVFVSSSLWEGLPLAILEAMAAGLPVAATEVGDVPQIVDADSGATVPPKDPAALACAIVSLLDDPIRARELGACGRQRVQREFGPAMWFDCHRMLYARLSKRIPSGGGGGWRGLEPRANSGDLAQAETPRRSRSFETESERC